ncbi:MAG: biotin/lipoyl-binding protein, partial [Acidobacteriota bacterium]
MIDLLQGAASRRTQKFSLHRNCSGPNRRRRYGLAALGLLAAIASATACKSTPPAASVPEVAVVTLGTERMALTTELPGRTTAYLVAEIRPQVNGILQKRLFTEGADVRAGSLLYQIDPAPYQAAFEQAKASLAVAEAKVPAARSRVERFKNLVAIHAVGQQDYDDAVSA